jgi:ATP-dependent RNA helicase DeaD
VRIAIRASARRRARCRACVKVAYSRAVARDKQLAGSGRVLDMETPTSAIVFCRTRLEVDELTEAMNARGYRAEALHGGFAQEQRDRVMKRFRARRPICSIATDVAARGLDIEHVSHVVNYDVPTEPTPTCTASAAPARAGREGVAITFVEPREQRLLRNIQQATQQKITIATIPTVADLSIDASSSRAPRCARPCSRASSTSSAASSPTSRPSSIRWTSPRRR